MPHRTTPLHTLALAGLLALLARPASAQALPDRSLTPGAANPVVTQQNIATTICRHGWAASVRPTEDYTETLKHQQMAQYGYHDHKLRDYEEDHLIPLELGGAPSDPANLWPERHGRPDAWGSFAKDRLENRLNQLVCDGSLPLQDAQNAIATDWIAAYRKYIGTEPDNRPLHYRRRYDDP